MHNKVMNQIRGISKEIRKPGSLQEFFVVCPLHVAEAGLVCLVILFLSSPVLC